MSRRSRYRLRQALRASLLLVIAVCLAWQPVLTALGEVHEATVHAASAVTHGDHSTPHDDPPNGDAEQDGSDGTLHVLLHYAHCCGYTVALAAVEFVPPGVVLAMANPRLPISPQVAASHLTSPFRPPIRA